jgi:hypothetical protein
MKCPDCGWTKGHEFTCPRYTFPRGDFGVRTCHFCHHPVTQHHWNCRVLREMDKRADAALRSLRAPMPIGCAVHGWEGPTYECPTCGEIADADVYDPMEAGL